MSYARKFYGTHLISCNMIFKCKNLLQLPNYEKLIKLYTQHSIMEKRVHYNCMVISGPKGCGKTTSLFMLCRYLQDADVKARGGSGGVQGVATPPNGQSHSIKRSTANVLSALIYIAKCLVVVVVSSMLVVKPLSRQAVVLSAQVLHSLECLSTVLVLFKCSR